MNHLPPTIIGLALLFCIFFLAAESRQEPVLRLPSEKDSLGTRWAVLIAGSSGYGNYRHQADICHAYQIMRKGGLKDENIVVFIELDLTSEFRIRPTMRISTLFLTLAVLGSMAAAPAASEGEAKCDVCEIPSSPPPPSPPPPLVIDCPPPPPPPRKHPPRPRPPPPSLLPCWPCDVNIAPPGNLYPLDPGFYPNAGVVSSLVDCLVVSFLLQFLAISFIIIRF